MIKERLAAILSQALLAAEATGQLTDIDRDLFANILIERPRQIMHGDLASPLALKLAAQSGQKRDALAIAGILADNLQSGWGEAGIFSAIKVSPPGFINFNLAPALAARCLIEIGLKGDHYGRDTAGASPFTASDWQDSATLPFFIDYAIARCNSILRNVSQPRVNVLSGELVEALMSPEEWRSFTISCRSQTSIYETTFMDHYDPFLRDFILTLSAFPEEVKNALHFRQPERIVAYAMDLSEKIDTFYQQENLGQGFFLTDLSVLKSRLGLIFVSRQVLSNVLGIIGLTAEEQM